MSSISQIQRAFDRAAKRYEQHAILQKQVAASVEQLCLQYLPVSKASGANIIDLGAGTGFVTLPLLAKYTKANITALDFSKSMLAKIPPHKNLRKLSADFVSYDFPESRYDLIVSSLALQWGQDLPHCFNNLQKALAEQGIFIFATLLAGSLDELRQSWQHIDDFDHVNAFIERQHLDQLLIDAQFTVLSQREENLTLFYDSVKHLLNSIKGIGANTIIGQATPVKGIGGKARIKALENAYEQYRKPQGLPLTYTVLWTVAAKRQRSA